MAILLPTESKSLKGRLIHGSIILVLLLGVVTMVYPFLVMLSGSVRSQMDEAELDLVPDYLVDDTALYRKFLEFKYNQDINALNRAHRSTYFSFGDIEAPAEVDLVVDVPGEIPFFHRVLGGLAADRTVQSNLRRLREHLIQRYEGELNTFIAEGGDPVPTWLNVLYVPARWYDTRYEHPNGPLYEAYTLLAEQRPDAEFQWVSLAGHFLETMVYPVFGRGDDALAQFNAAAGLDLSAFSGFRLPLTVEQCQSPGLRKLWIDYVRQELNPAFLSVQDRDAYEERYQAGLQDEFSSIEELNAAWGTSHLSFRAIALPRGVWLRGQHRQAYQRYLDTVSDDALLIIPPAGEYLSAEAVAAVEWRYARDHSGSLRRQFAARNYINVWDELAGEGRALTNTIIYCALSIVLALLVNPLAAYGLSRFKLRGGYKVLLILMATMAFPPMVTLSSSCFATWG